MLNYKIVLNKPIVLKTKVNNTVYHFKSEFSLYLDNAYLDLVANIKLKLKEDKSLISFENSLLTRVMGLTSLCCNDHAEACLTDSVNPELVALGLKPMTLEDSAHIKRLVENEINYFIGSKIQALAV